MRVRSISRISGKRRGELLFSGGGALDSEDCKPRSCFEAESLESADPLAFAATDMDLAIDAPTCEAVSASGRKSKPFS